MTKYLKVTKKPVYEDAVQFRHDLPKSWNLCHTFVGAKWSQTRNAGFVNTAYVETPEGRTALVDGDFIVYGLNQGEFFVLSEVQFHESYDIIASMRKWEPKKGILDDKDPWDDIPVKNFHAEWYAKQEPLTKVEKLIVEPIDMLYTSEEMRALGMDFDEQKRSKRLSTPMDHILSDLRSQAAALHGEKVRKNDKTETDG
ncbi:MAG: hypothetical protein RR643_05215 [Anaerorhabdus sp.]|uniref:hypothetical protein n=1 Tax=Anaerorhabdus sp. TaxID=1872524 RepID=UPI002FC9AAE3